MVVMVCMLMMLLPGDSADSLGDYLTRAMNALPGTFNSNGEVYPDTVIAGFETIQEVNEISESLDTIGQLVTDNGVGNTCTWEEIPTGIKTVTTSRVRITTLTFDWLGQKRTVEDRKVLWTKTRKLVKKEDWVEAKD